MVASIVMYGSSPRIAITDALEENKVAGGGLFIHYANISEKSAEVFVNTEVRNNDSKPHAVIVENSLVSYTEAKPQRTKLSLKAGEVKTITQRFLVKNPKLWSPETPYLYHIATRIKEGKQSLDGGITKIGMPLASRRASNRSMVVSRRLAFVASNLFARMMPKVVSLASISMARSIISW